MKKALAALAVAVTLCCASAAMAQDTPTQDNPIGTHEVCHRVRVQNPPADNHQIAGTAVGAVAGGLLGSTIGHGKGNVLATAGGAVAGGYAGKKVQENNQANHPTYHYEQRCYQSQG